MKQRVLPLCQAAPARLFGKYVGRDLSRPLQQVIQGIIEIPHPDVLAHSIHAALPLSFSVPQAVPSAAESPHPQPWPGHALKCPEYGHQKYQNAADGGLVIQP